MPSVPYPKTPREFWESFRNRPEMYVDTVTMDGLFRFFSGYSLAIHINKVAVDDDPFLIPGEFHEWVAYRLHMDHSSPAGWAYVIREHAEDECQAFQLFLRLYDEFRARKPHVVARLVNFQKTYEVYEESCVDQERVWVKVTRRYPENMSLITYTDDPGFFLKADDDPDFFQRDFFPNFKEFQSRFGVTLDQLVILDPEWNPPREPIEE